MATGKVFNYITLGILITIIAFGIMFVRACNNGFGYQAGSGLGSTVDIGKEKYKHSYLKKYSDTFFTIYPQYRVPLNDPTENLTSGYEFLNLTKFYFDTKPKEIYCVQWEGTGFISVRFAYNYETGQSIVENERENITVDDIEKLRMTNRLRKEILDKLDSIIDKSIHRDSAMKIPSF